MVFVDARRTTALQSLGQGTQSRLRIYRPGHPPAVSVVVGLGIDFMPQIETCRLYNLFRSGQKPPSVFIWFVFEHHFKCHGEIPCIGVARQDFPTFDKGEVLIELCLQGPLMLYRIGPIEMVTYCKNDVPGFLVNAYYIDDVKLLDGHWNPLISNRGCLGRVARSK